MLVSRVKFVLYPILTKKKSIKLKTKLWIVDISVSDITANQGQRYQVSNWVVLQRYRHYKIWVYGEDSISFKQFVYLLKHCSFRRNILFYSQFKDSSLIGWWDRKMSQLCNFYWFRIDTKHLTEPWLDQALMESAYKWDVTC